jgi:uncharacterized RDD family membrane protein YckC
MADPADLDADDDETKDSERDVEVTSGEIYRLPAGKTIRNLTVALGKAKVEGRILGDVVVVGGKLTLVGAVDGSVQCVGGHVTLGSKSTVAGDVAGFGTLDRHPGSVIKGREALKWTPTVRDMVQQKPADWLNKLGPNAEAFWTHHVVPGRPLSFSVGWPWVVLVTVVLIQGVLVVLVPGAVRSTSAMLCERPAVSLLLGLVSIPLLFLVGSVALATVVGFPFFLMAVVIGTLIGKIALEVELGAKLLSLVGLGTSRRAPIGGMDSVERSMPLWGAFFVGVVVLAALYLVPYLGITLWGGLTLWGIGAVVLTVFSRRKSKASENPPSVFGPRPVPGGTMPPPSPAPFVSNPKDSATAPTMATAAPAAAAAAALSVLSVRSGSADTLDPVEPVPATAIPISTLPLVEGIASDPIPAATGGGAPFSSVPFSAEPGARLTSEPSIGAIAIPRGAAPRVLPAPRPAAADPWSQTRVGLGPRMLALLVDVVVLAVASEILPSWLRFIPKADAVGTILYFVGFWVWRGTSIGGVVVGLRIVRLDGRRLDWQVALVRSLASFLSLFSAGLGQFWCVWDPEQQTWQDKLAGTVVVKDSQVRALI